MMFTYWPPGLATSRPMPSSPFCQLSLPDQLDLAHHHFGPFPAPGCCFSSLPHSFPGAINSGALYHCPRRRNASEQEKHGKEGGGGQKKRSAATQTEMVIDNGTSPSSTAAEEDQMVEDAQLEALCAQVAECLLQIADGWAAKLEQKKWGPEPGMGLFARVRAVLIRCC